MLQRSMQVTINTNSISIYDVLERTMGEFNETSRSR